MDDLIPPETVNRPAMTHSSPIATRIVGSSIDTRVPCPSVDLDDQSMIGQREVHHARVAVEPWRSELGFEARESGRRIPLQERSLEHGEVDVSPGEQWHQNIAALLNAGSTTASHCEVARHHLALGKAAAAERSSNEPLSSLGREQGRQFAHRSSQGQTPNVRNELDIQICQIPGLTHEGESTSIRSAVRHNNPGQSRMAEVEAMKLSCRLEICSASPQ